jgi:hypothetical protein
MRRRQFFGLAAAAVPGLAATIDVKSIHTRGAKKVEIAYKSPHTAPNGLQATPEGLWVVDDRTVDGLNYVSLLNFADGKVIREFQVAGLSAPSGMTVDASGTLWINSTHSGLIFNCSSQDGKVLAKYASPGTGTIYRMKGDPPAARSPLPPAYPPAAQNASAQGKTGRPRGEALPPGQVSLTATAAPPGEGGQGMEYRDGALAHCHSAYAPVVRAGPEDLAGSGDVAIGWQSRARSRLGRRYALGGRHQLESVLPPRPENRRDRRENSVD